MNTDANPAENGERVSIYPASIQKELDALEKDRLAILALAPHAAIAEEVATAFKGKWEPKDSWDDNIKATVGVGFSRINGALLMLSSKDTDCVAPVLRALRARGYKVKGHEDTADIGRRTYDLGDIKVLMFVPTGDSAEGARCRFVVKGYEQKPVYELMCGEKALPSAADAEAEA